MPVNFRAIFVEPFLAIWEADPNSKGFLRIYWREISLKFLHIFLVANIDRLFALFIPSKLVTPIQLVRGVWGDDAFAAEEISLRQ